MYKLTRFATPWPDPIVQRHHWPIRIDAAFSLGDAPASIFVMHNAPPGGLVGNFFSCVASVQQLEDLPVDDPESGVPFYRVASITHLCRTAEAAAEFWESVQSATQELANNVEASLLLAQVEEVTIIPN